MIDELNSFVNTMKQKGWTDNMLRVHIPEVTWWGSEDTMPTFRDNWTEGLWVGWKLRSKIKEE